MISHKIKLKVNQEILLENQEIVLEKEIVTDSSVLAWRLPGTGEPGGLPSMGLDMSMESDTTEVT